MFEFESNLNCTSRFPDFNGHFLLVCKNVVNSFNMLNDVMCALFLSSFPLLPLPFTHCVCVCVGPTLHATILSAVLLSLAMLLLFYWVFVLGALLFCWFSAFIVALVIWNADGLGRLSPWLHFECSNAPPKIVSLNS